MKTNAIWMFCMLLAIIVVFSCKKETLAPSLNYTNPIDTIPPLDSNLIIGIEAPGVNVHTYPSPQIVGDFDLDLDVDEDGYIDIRFLGYWDNWDPGVKYTQINSTNDSVEIALMRLPDTLFCCVESFYDTSNNQTYWSSTYSNTEWYYNCDGNETIQSTYIETPNPYNLGDTLNKQILWTNSDVILAEKSLTLHITGDYNWIYYTKYSFWLDLNKKYIVYRKRSNGVWNYGWVQLWVTGYDELQIFEYAYKPTDIS